MNIRSLFCNHLYIKSVCAKWEKHGNHNHVYDIELYKCEKCNHFYTVKVLRNIEPCKTCIEKDN